MKIDRENFKKWKKLGDKSAPFQGVVEANLVII